MDTVDIGATDLDVMAATAEDRENVLKKCFEQVVNLLELSDEESATLKQLCDLNYHAGVSTGLDTAHSMIFER